MTLKQATLLVVDDNEDNRYTLTRRLERLGYTQVSTATNGREALELAADRDFDLMLLDIMMPEMSGYELLERLREEGRLATLPVIVISALGELESVVRCIELGAEDYLTKPFNGTLLRARLAATLEKKALRDAVAQQLKVIREIFGRFVPEGVAEAIVQGRGTLRPTKTMATVLYSDISSFTTIAEGMTPEQVVQMLNEYFPAVIEPVARHGGVVNQFQGDAMLITFNVPVEDPLHAEHAVQAAREMDRIVRDRTFAGVELSARIGINTGAVIAGNVGSGELMNYTVHGNAVNLAARLEQVNKEFGTRILVSASTRALLRDDGGLAPVGPVTVRGVQDPVHAYRLED